jgi:hypothetical protein
MTALVLTGGFVLLFFLVLYARRPSGRCVKGCHGCGGCGPGKKDEKEGLTREND